MKKIYWLLIIMFLLSPELFSQEPPITADKPMMLSRGSFTVKTLVEIRKKATDLIIHEGQLKIINYRDGKINIFEQVEKYAIKENLNK